jgi:hypothetical protein
VVNEAAWIYYTELVLVLVLVLFVHKPFSLCSMNGYIKATRPPANVRSKNILLHRPVTKRNNRSNHYRQLLSHHIHFTPHIPTTTMQPSMLFSLIVFILSPLATATCSNSYNGHSCSGSIYGTINNNGNDISQLICCEGSSSCNFNTNGSITKCDSGTQIALSDAGAGAPASDAKALMAPMALVLCAGIFAVGL